MSTLHHAHHLPTALKKLTVDVVHTYITHKDNKTLNKINKKSEIFSYKTHNFLNRNHIFVILHTQAYEKKMQYYP